MSNDILDAAEARSLEGGASYPWSHRLFRAIWQTVWLVLASWTPVFCHPWRRFLLRLFGAKVASTAGVYGSARIWYPPNFEIGAYAYVGPGANIYSMAMITLDDYAIVSQGAHLCTGTHDIDSPHFQLKAHPIHVGERAWIAAEAFVGPGVTVHKGAVLGARSCAFRDLPPWSVNGGNPARYLRDRKVQLDRADGA